VLVADVKLLGGRTVYERFADTPLVLACLGLMGAAGLVARRRGAGAPD
jgi:hypothetical protein